MINGFHTIVASEDPEATRAFFRDVLAWPWLDAHDGWLIFKAPPGELGVHPTAGGSALPSHEAALMCDDLDATVADLRAKGVVVAEGVEQQAWGLTTTIEVPGAGSMMLYQPRHALAHALEG